MTSCEIELAGPQITACSQGSSFLPSAITQDMFCLELPSKQTNGFLSSNLVSVTVDNFLSPSHTLVQIFCQDHKGLVYDTMRTLKDYNIQVYDLYWLELFLLFCWNNFHLLELSWCLEGVFETQGKNEKGDENNDMSKQRMEIQEKIRGKLFSSISCGFF